MANNDLLKAEAEASKAQANAIVNQTNLDTLSDIEVRDNGATLQQKYNEAKHILAQKIIALPMPKLVWSKEVNASETNNDQ